MLHQPPTPSCSLNLPPDICSLPSFREFPFSTEGMSKKAQQADHEEATKRRRILSSFPSVIPEVANNQKLLLSVFEPLLRKVVKEEVETALTKHLSSTKRHCGKQIYPSMSKSLQLQFRNKLSLPIFTGSKIDGDGSGPLSIALVDALTGQVVSDGPESASKVEIVVLEGDFDGDDEDNWTFKDFVENIVRERDGKRPLLAGDLFFNLQEGVGVVGELAFTDNSSWTRSRKFRLGARMPDNKFDNNIRVREAKSESFVVKDHRGELYKKHYPPSLADEVWRLEKIGKDGAFHKRLSSENIKSVKDFLTWLSLDGQRLRNILGNGMSAKMWEVTIEHARTCTLNKESYIYYAPAERRIGVVFNVIGELSGIKMEQQFMPAKILSDSQKIDAHKLIKMAYKHWEDVISYGHGSISLGSSDLSAIAFSCNSSGEENAYSNSKFGSITFASSDDACSDTIASLLGIEKLRSCSDYALSAEDNLDVRNISDPPLYVGSQTFSDGDLQYYEEDPAPGQNVIHRLESESELGLAVSGFLAMPKATARTRWTILNLLFQWKFRIKKIIALKRRKAVEVERDN